MVLQTFFTEGEIDLLITALTAQETKWNALAKKGVQGYGKATELATKEKQARTANEYSELLSKIVEYTI